MGLLDVEKLLAEISPEAPCGEDLSYDAAYVEFDRSAQGKPEEQVGTSVKPAEEPNWHEVAKGAVEFLGRTKDLRIILYATVAALKLEGLPGLRDGLALLRGVLERYWDHVYPQLDPEDPDPVERANIIASLIQPESNMRDPMRFVRRVREAPLCDSRQLGRFSLRDVQIARGEVAAPADAAAPRADKAQIDAAFADTEIDFLQAIARAAAEAAALVAGIDAFLTEKIGAGRAPDLAPFVSVIQEASKELQAQLAKRGVGAPPAAAEGAAAPAEAAPGGAPAQRLSGVIASTQDVIAAIDKICRYYEAHEPSSPVPLLLRRAQRLVSRSFIEIIQDLTPEAIQRIQDICGLDREKAGS